MIKRASIKSFLYPIILLIIMLFYACNSNPYGDKIDISSEQEIKESIIGKWRSSENYNGYLVEYRFEITENQVKCWKSGGIIDWNQPKREWESKPDEIVNYSVGSILNGGNCSDGECRTRIIAQGESFGKLILFASAKENIGWFKQQISDVNENSLFKGWEIK